MTTVRRVFIYSLLNFEYFFVILFPFGILSHDPIIDSSHWLRKYVNRVMDRENFLVYLAATLFLALFLRIFGICYCFHCHKTYSHVLLITVQQQTKLLPVEA